MFIIGKYSFLSITDLDSAAKSDQSNSLMHHFVSLAFFLLSAIFYTHSWRTKAVGGGGNGSQKTALGSKIISDFY